MLIYSNFTLVTKYRQTDRELETSQSYKQQFSLTFCRSPFGFLVLKDWNTNVLQVAQSLDCLTRLYKVEFFIIILAQWYKSNIYVACVNVFWNRSLI